MKILVIPASISNNLALTVQNLQGEGYKISLCLQLYDCRHVLMNDILTVYNLHPVYRNKLNEIKLQQAAAAKRNIFSSGPHPIPQPVQTSIPLTIASTNNDPYFYSPQQINNRLNSFTNAFKSDGNFSQPSE